MEAKKQCRPGLWVLPAAVLTVGALLVAVAPANAAKPPVGRTYFTAFFGLEEPYELATNCFVFEESGFCSQNGQMCGSWQRQDRKGKETGFYFEISFVDQGFPVMIAGQARADDRGSKSAIAGAGLMTRPGSVANFSFAAREVEESRCLELLQGSPGTNPTVVIGSGTVASESRAVGDFHSVTMAGVGQVDIRNTGVESLRVTADDNLLQYLNSEVRNRRLFLGSDPEVTFSTRNPIEFDVTVSELDEIRVAGVAGVDASGIDTDTLSVNIAGVAAVTTEGRVDKQKVTILGVSGYRGRNLRSRTAQVDLAGVCNAVVRVDERLSGRVLGLCKLEYIGNPTLDLEVAATASVRRIDG